MKSTAMIRMSWRCQNGVGGAAATPPRGERAASSLPLAGRSACFGVGRWRIARGGERVGRETKSGGWAVIGWQCGSAVCHGQLAMAPYHPSTPLSTENLSVAVTTGSPLHTVLGHCSAVHSGSSPAARALLRLSGHGSSREKHAPARAPVRLLSSPRERERVLDRKIQTTLVNYCPSPTPPPPQTHTRKPSAAPLTPAAPSRAPLHLPRGQRAASPGWRVRAARAAGACRRAARPPRAPWRA